MAEQALYGHVADGSLTDGPRTLPSSWRADDAEILAFDRLDDPTPYGWWPWVEGDAPAFDPAKQRIKPVVRLDAKAKRIARGYVVVDLSAEEIAAADPVPDVVTNYQARAALIGAGLFDKANAAVRASGDAIAVQAWDYANQFYRTSPIIAALAGGLDLKDAEIDDLFRAAAKVV